jgi:hypothetical protein
VAAPAVVGSVSRAEQNPTTSLAVPVPAGVTAGETLVAFIVASGGTTTQPAGWNRAAGSNNPGTTVAVYVDTWIATNSEPASYTWTGITSGRATGFMCRVSGDNTVTVFDVTPSVGTNTGVGANCVIASQTTVTNDTLLMTVVGGNAAVGLTWTPPAGMSTLSSSTGTGRGASLAAVSQPIAGATGTQTWSWSSTNLEMRAVMVAIRPAVISAGAASLGGSGTLTASGVVVPATAGAASLSATGFAIADGHVPSFTVFRPDLGTVTRPNTGTVIRPNTGLVVRPRTEE